MRMTNKILIRWSRLSAASRTRIGVALAATLLIWGGATATVTLMGGHTSSSIASHSPFQSHSSGTPITSSPPIRSSPSPSASPFASPIPSGRPTQVALRPSGVPRSLVAQAAQSVPSGPCPAFLLRDPRKWRILDNCQVRVLTGTVVSIHHMHDGDWHVNVLVDAPFRNLLVAANYQNTCSSGFCGPGAKGGQPIMICEIVPHSRWAPSPSVIPAVGTRIWIAGTHVLDIGHLSWAELHPVYAWHLL